MVEDVRTSQRDLVARVATLELLVSDLIDLLWRLDPDAMRKLALDASHDLDIQHSRTALPAAEHLRERLYSVLQDRKRRLQQPRSGAGRRGETARP
jgi:hypothetical protein